MSDPTPQQQVTFALEQRLEERDKHYDQRFAALGREVNSLARSVERGFDEIREELKSSANRQPTISMAQMISLLSFIVFCITVAGGVVMLVITPVQTDQNRQQIQLAALQASLMAEAVSNAGSDSESRVQREIHREWLQVLSDKMDDLAATAADTDTRSVAKDAEHDARLHGMWEWLQALDDNGPRAQNWRKRDE